MFWMSWQGLLKLIFGIDLGRGQINCLRVLLHAYMYAKLAHELAMDFLILVKIAFVWNLSKMYSN